MYTRRSATATVLTTYERLQQRIRDGQARGEDVSAFETALAALPVPQHILDAERYEAQRKALAERQAYVELVREARAAGDIAGLMYLFELAYDEVVELIEREREQQRIAAELDQSLRPMLESVLDARRSQRRSQRSLRRSLSRIPDYSDL